MSEQCHESIEVDEMETGHYGGVLACWLAVGHDGPHYDEGDNLTWKRGRPDA